MGRNSNTFQLNKKTSRQCNTEPKALFSGRYNSTAKDIISVSRERPIIFTKSMILSLLNGTKTQTRRAYKNRKHPDFGCDIAASELVREEQHVIDRTCPYGNPGDLLWVRETFSGPYCFEAQPGISALPPSKWGKSSPIHYWADGDPDHGDWTKPRPSIFMPRWASRITLEITNVRVERLQDISEADAIAEGGQWTDNGPRKWLQPGIAFDDAYKINGWNEGWSHIGETDQDKCLSSAMMSYANLWESINGTGSWGVDPWVWVLEFRRSDQ